MCGLGRPRVTSDLGSHDLEVFLWCKKILILALHTKYKPCSYSGTTSNRILNDEMASSGLWIVQILYFRPIPELRLLIKSFLNLNKVCSSQSDKCRLLNRSWNEHFKRGQLRPPKARLPRPNTFLFKKSDVLSKKIHSQNSQQIPPCLPKRHTLWGLLFH